MKKGYPKGLGKGLGKGKDKGKKGKPGKEVFAISNIDMLPLNSALMVQRERVKENHLSKAKGNPSIMETVVRGVLVTCIGVKQALP
jgi:hypothetical protein